MKPRIYLDFNATAPLIPAARVAVISALDRLGGNPSSIHAEGRAARDLVERARDAVARLVGRAREQVVFTSGGTEANHLGVASQAALVERDGRPRVVATTTIEHPSLLGAIDGLVARGWERRFLTPGAADLTGVGLLAVAVVNHELGTVLDLSIVSAAVAAGARVHLDAVQAAGKLSLADLAADSLAISAHKLGGTPGTGALVFSEGADAALPVVEAGHQERGRRGGTENVLGIVAFGAAADVDLRAWEHATECGDRLEAGLVTLGAQIHGAEVARVGGTVNARFAGVRGESLVIALDLAGVAVSTGAACTSGTVQPSRVVGALYGDVAAREAVRFSLGRPTTMDDVSVVLSLVPQIVERARARTHL
jgi:cysteine desulfurase